MKKYKVKKGNIGGFGGRTFEIGDTVSENDFPTGNAKPLAKLKLLEEIKEKAETPAAKNKRLKAEAIQLAIPEVKDAEDVVKAAEDVVNNAEKGEAKEAAEIALEAAKTKFEEKTEALAELNK